MAWNMSKDNLDMAWWAIVGSTEQSILNKVESRVAVLEEGSLQAHVSRLTHRQGIDIDKQKQQQSIVKVTYDKEYPLHLSFIYYIYFLILLIINYILFFIFIYNCYLIYLLIFIFNKYITLIP